MGWDETGQFNTLLIDIGEKRWSKDRVTRPVRAYIGDVECLCLFWTGEINL
jgi:hypothetical protein